VVYRDGDTDFELSNSGGDTVRLFSGAITSGGVLVDSHTYARSAPDNKSFARIPDGAANWIDPDGTPGEPNLFFFEPLLDANPSEPPFEASQKPSIDISPPNIETPYVEPPPVVTTEVDSTASGTDDTIIEPKDVSEEAPSSTEGTVDIQNASSTIDIALPSSENVSSTPSDTTGNEIETVSSTTESVPESIPENTPSAPPEEGNGSENVNTGDNATPEATS
jgi:hypothetical protein